MQLNENKNKADAVINLFWDNFLASERAFVMRDVIAVELAKAEARGIEKGRSR